MELLLLPKPELGLLSPLVRQISFLEFKRTNRLIIELEEQVVWPGVCPFYVLVDEFRCYYIEAVLVDFLDGILEFSTSDVKRASLKDFFTEITDEAFSHDN